MPARLTCVEHWEYSTPPVHDDFSETSQQQDYKLVTLETGRVITRPWIKQDWPGLAGSLLLLGRAWRHRSVSSPPGDGDEAGWTNLRLFPAKFTPEHLWRRIAKRRQYRVQKKKTFRPMYAYGNPLVRYGTRYDCFMYCSMVGICL